MKYENRYIEAGKIDNSFMQSITLGFAPYIGDYGDYIHGYCLKLCIRLKK